MLVFDAMFEFIEHVTNFNLEYPSRLVCLVLVDYILVLVLIALRKRKVRLKDCYFCYCMTSRNNVVSRETVSEYEYLHYDEIVGYPVLGITRDTIYFLITD